MSNNLSCHWCHVSKSRYYKINKVYIDCDVCPKSYCEVCCLKYPNIRPNDDGCLYCKNFCCCRIKCNKHKSHFCCYNYRRHLDSISETKVFRPQFKITPKVRNNKLMPYKVTTFTYNVNPIINKYKIPDSVLNESADDKSFPNVSIPKIYDAIILL